MVLELSNTTNPGTDFEMPLLTSFLAHCKFVSHRLFHTHIATLFCTSEVVSYRVPCCFDVRRLLRAGYLENIKFYTEKTTRNNSENWAHMMGCDGNLERKLYVAHEFAKQVGAFLFYYFPLLDGHCVLLMK